MIEIFGQIINAIPQRGSPQSLSAIADKARISYDTAERYMEIVLMIQAAGKVEVSQIGEQKGYSQRESRKKIK